MFYFMLPNTLKLSYVFISKHKVYLRKFTLVYLINYMYVNFEQINHFDS